MKFFKIPKELQEEDKKMTLSQKNKPYVHNVVQLN